MQILIGRLAVICEPPGDSDEFRGQPACVAPGDRDRSTRRFESVVRLAAQEQCQAILLQQNWVLLALMCVVYKVFMMSRSLAYWCSLSCGSKHIP